MAQFNITLDSEIIKGLFSLSGRDDTMTKLLESVLNQVLEAQATESIGAEPYERTEERKCYRNGTNEQAFVLAMMEMVIQGVSTRKVTKITEELCGTSFSKSTISNLCKNLDPIVEEFKNRLLKDEYPFVIVDAIYVKSREHKKVRSKAVMIAMGVRSDGIREILGFMTGNSEAETSWRIFFENLKIRGLKGVDLVVSDAHKGLKSAIQKEFQGVTWQRCQTHFSRNILDVCPKRLQEDLKEELKELYDARESEVARELLTKILNKYSEQASKSMEILEEGFEDIIQALNLPTKYRKRLRTSNIIERLNQEVRRRERVIRIFPNDESIERLIGAVLIDLDEKCNTGRTWLDMREYYEYKEKNLQEEKQHFEDKD